MKQQKLLAIAIAVLAAFGCNQTTESDTATDSTGPKPRDPRLYNFTPSYSASFETGSVENTETIMSLYRSWDDNKLGEAEAKFSDSVYMYFWDGGEMITTRDSMMAGMKSYRANFKGMETKLNAVISVKESKTSEDWVLVWVNEIRTDNAGKVDSTQMQETWGLDKNGRVKTLYQYGQMAPKKEDKK